MRENKSDAGTRKETAPIVTFARLTPDRRLHSLLSIVAPIPHSPSAMPPKCSKPVKAEVKKKEKIAEVSSRPVMQMLTRDFVRQDKTFGLKNKKGAKTQKFIQHVQKTTLGNAAEKKKEPTKKEEKLKKMEELNTLFRPVQPVQKDRSRRQSQIRALRLLQTG